MASDIRRKGNNPHEQSHKTAQASHVGKGTATQDLLDCAGLPES
jgi:hypothetical protein